MLYVVLVSNSRNITVSVHILQGIVLDTTSWAVPIGTICNELVTNAIKYAFTTQNTEGSISVTFTDLQTALQLEVSDTGTGLKQPLSQLIEQKTSGGLSLVKDYVDILQGVFESTANTPSGTRYVVRLPFK